MAVHWPSFLDVLFILGPFQSVLSSPSPQPGSTNELVSCCVLTLRNMSLAQTLHRNRIVPCTVQDSAVTANS
ncbi:hypothetical protein C7212DRAFT_319629 [Tuber magnatum]|uniref:Secreted protein n=1 Tax=Tuber magnatum TaxID=42249 RepID=A0A317SQ00_9PEZI|nr:hypothetical protein C7212DRAFT_319629 [Tuber magnatum]